MPRKTRKDKELARLRREVEALRAQLKNASEVSAASMTSTAKKRRPAEKPGAAFVIDVRSDLRKTLILTAICLGVLFALYLTQSRWSVRIFGV